MARFGTVGDLLKDADDANTSTEVAFELREIEKEAAAFAARVSNFRAKFHSALTDEESRTLQTLGVSIAKAKRAMGRRSFTKNGNDAVRDAEQRLAEKYAERDRLIKSKTGTHRERQDLGRSISQLEVALSEYAR